MEKVMKDSHEIDESFKAIKTATGVTDVGEMVKKFLSRETTYSSLLMNVSDSERKTEQLKKDNEMLRTRLQTLKIDLGSDAEGDGGDLENKFNDEDIVEMKMRKEQ